ncbi:peroxisomal membrane protein [Coccidioides immitis RS]|uniref:Peroxisomal membrane protein n=3 Tax=Coccidioides immitis TaxID=5501 RepID=J3KKS3_COCIM|nr:peroxisomal membrane protein [Coccidioides immitis RS]EAS36799.3 peroxisomal membrane protein [Coccidioides immitis RS]
MDSLRDALNTIALKPELAPLLAILKSARNGAVYGSKVRFPHALVMIFLFRSGSLHEKTRLVLKATKQHARNLATFAIVYKSSMLALRYLSPGGSGKEGPYDTFFAGLLGGYVVFGRSRSSVTQQIVIYVFARVVLAMARLSIDPKPNPLASFISRNAREEIKTHAWPAFASLSWAFVMYLFRWHPEAIQSSLRSSMTYIYSDCDHWDSIETLFLRNK